MIRSLAQVGITCSNIEKSLEFYNGILGLPLLEALDVPEDQVRDIYGLNFKDLIDIYEISGRQLYKLSEAWTKFKDKHRT